MLSSSKSIVEERTQSVNWVSQLESVNRLPNMNCFLLLHKLVKTPCGLSFNDEKFVNRTFKCVPLRMFPVSSNMSNCRTQWT